MPRRNKRSSKRCIASCDAVQWKELVSGFFMRYESGEPVSDGKENSEALFMDIEEAINHPDLTNMTRLCLQMYQKSSESALRHYPDYGAEKGFSLYGTDM